jgi:Zn-dependent protease with chaperone function
MQSQQPPDGWGPTAQMPPHLVARRELTAQGMPARHTWEIPLLVLTVAVTALAYTVILGLVLAGHFPTAGLVVLPAPAVVYVVRGLQFARQRVNGVKMSPTQFPEGYRMVAEAAARFAMAQAPDAYVVLGNGTLNAFAAGHGFRRYVVVTSDLFEIGGAARDPDALAFVVGHEVGHIAAGHTSYWRLLGMYVGQYIPILNSALSRAQEYTADNHGYVNRPQGAAAAMTTLAAGKYLNRVVAFDELADRAPVEGGPFVWLVNALSSHPVLTWRSWALRDRGKHGNLFLPPSWRTAAAQPAYNQAVYNTGPIPAGPDSALQ